MLLVRTAVFLSVVGAFGGASLATVLRALYDENRRDPALQWRIRAGGAAMTVGIATLELLARRYAPVGGGVWRYLLAVERSVALMLWATALVLWCLRAARGLHRVTVPNRALGEALEPGVSSNEITVKSEVSREIVPRRVALGSMGLGAFTVLRGGLRERHDLQLTDVTLTVADLPPSLEGLTMVQLTDLHIGVFTGAQELDQLLRVVRSARGDLVVLTGDIFDNNPAHIAEGMRALSTLRARLGVYGILGNHDHVTGARAVVEGLRAGGIRALVNGSLRLSPNGREGIILAGVDDVIARRAGGGPDLRRALEGQNREEPCVLLAHNPVYFDEAAGRVAVQLSGHTHGGQINPLGHPVVRMPYVAGRYTRQGSQLFVSRGIGITGPPVRLNAPPEVVRLSLTSRRG